MVELIAGVWLVGLLADEHEATVKTNFMAGSTFLVFFLLHLCFVKQIPFFFKLKQLAGWLKVKYGP